MLIPLLLRSVGIGRRDLPGPRAGPLVEELDGIAVDEAEGTRLDVELHGLAVRRRGRLADAVLLRQGDPSVAFSIGIEFVAIRVIRGDVGLDDRRFALVHDDVIPGLDEGPGGCRLR